MRRNALELVDTETEARHAGAAPMTHADRAADAAQLMLLASTVLQKSHDDLSALAEADPNAVWGWIESFARLKAKAESDARLWTAALASLSTASAPLAAAE